MEISHVAALLACSSKSALGLSVQWQMVCLLDHGLFLLKNTYIPLGSRSELGRLLNPELGV